MDSEAQLNSLIATISSLQREYNFEISKQEDLKKEIQLLKQNEESVLEKISIQEDLIQNLSNEKQSKLNSLHELENYKSFQVQKKKMGLKILEAKYEFLKQMLFKKMNGILSNETRILDFTEIEIHARKVVQRNERNTKESINFINEQQEYKMNLESEILSLNEILLSKMEEIQNHLPKHEHIITVVENKDESVFDEVEGMDGVDFVGDVDGVRRVRESKLDSNLDPKGILIKYRENYEAKQKEFITKKNKNESLIQNIESIKVDIIKKKEQMKMIESKLRNLR